MESLRADDERRACTMTEAPNSGRMGEARRTVHLRVTGRVQGVSFRAWTAEMAGSLQLEGWVRNRRDGSVEALLSGHPDAVDQMVKVCQQGPPDAQVEKVEITGEGGAAPRGFTVLPAA
jgi:acylphosphatase